jgi:hypothetical protein
MTRTQCSTSWRASPPEVIHGANWKWIAPSFPAACSGSSARRNLPQNSFASPYFASGQLEEVLTDQAGSSPALFLYFPSRIQVMPKLRAFIDHVRAYAEAVLLNPARKLVHAKSVRPRVRRR